MKFLLILILLMFPIISNAYNFGKVVLIKNNVLLKKAIVKEERLKSPLTSSSLIYIGDKIETQKDSSVRILIDNVLFQMEPETVVEINYFKEESKINITMEKGAIHALVGDLFPVYEFNVDMQYRSILTRSGGIYIAINSPESLIVSTNDSRSEFYLNQKKMLALPKTDKFYLEKTKIVYNTLDNLKTNLKLNANDIETGIPENVKAKGWSLLKKHEIYTLFDINNSSLVKESYSKAKVNLWIK